jgi:hypothetical protein
LNYFPYSLSISCFNIRFTFSSVRVIGLFKLCFVRGTDKLRLSVFYTHIIAHILSGTDVETQDFAFLRPCHPENPTYITCPTLSGYLVIELSCLLRYVFQSRLHQTGHFNLSLYLFLYLRRAVSIPSPSGQSL